MTINSKLRGIDYQFETKPGLFSKSEIDPGTKLLIENMSLETGDTVLDIGCGYGPIGIVAANTAKQGTVYLVDVDIRAIKFSLSNARLNNAKNVIIKASDGFEELKDVKFDKILSNPPSHLPKETLIEFIEGAKKQLNKGGKIYFVTEKRISPLIKREFLRVFGNYQALINKDQYLISVALQS